MNVHTIQKKIVTDENMHPVAVQIDYHDWLNIEQELDLRDDKNKTVDLACFMGILSLDEDPLEYQRRIRDEWP